MQAYESVLWVVEGRGDGSDDNEPERFPQLDGGPVRLDHRVELHAGVAGGPSPRKHVLAQRSSDASALISRINHERCGRDVRAASRPVRAHLRGAQDVSTLDRDDGDSGWLFHPPGMGLLERLARGKRIGLTRFDDCRVEPIDARPFLRLCGSDFHSVNASEKPTMRSAALASSWFSPEVGVAAHGSAQTTQLWDIHSRAIVHATSAAQVAQIAYTYMSVGTGSPTLKVGLLTAAFQPFGGIFTPICVIGPDLLMYQSPSGLVSENITPPPVA